MSAPGWDTPPFSSVLEPASHEASRILGLWWVFCGVSTAIWLAVMALTLVAMLRRPKSPGTREPQAEPGPEPRLQRSIAAATTLTVVVLFALLVASVGTGRALHASNAESGPPLRIQVTGARWWWKVVYPADPSSQSVETANEIHVPVGRPVVLELASHDVIHSLWLPELQGKRDLIPGRPAELRFTATRPGTFRGQCAEFCGLQHAHMGLLLIAESPASFETWRVAQLRPAAPPVEPEAKRGEQVFLSAACPLCHGVRGTAAAASRGPDLTHLMSRSTLGAATLPNTRGHLAGWVLDPQTVKLGNLMPPNLVPAAELQPLLAYLTSLK
jgi:cytochrome c oxidase subunit 2